MNDKLFTDLLDSAEEMVVFENELKSLYDSLDKLPNTTKNIDDAITKIEEELPIDEITEEVLNRKYSL